MIAPESGLLFPRSGFVVAVRGRWAARSKMADLFEWIVLSRFGPRNEYLALQRTEVAAFSGEAPLHLRPRWTAVATLGEVSERSARTPSATFRLNHALPSQVLVAGDFVAARGYVRIYGTKPSLAIESAGRWLKPGPGSEFRLSGERVPWFGEFFDTDSM
jgi:hypothetical protein